jgi:hypothetical protein
VLNDFVIVLKCGFSRVLILVGRLPVFNVTKANKNHFSMLVFIFYAKNVANKGVCCLGK